MAALIALAAGGLAGCVAPIPVRVTWDEREDLSRFRTWDWIEGDAVFVRGPFGDDTEVARQLSALVERSLRERGLEHAPGSSDLRVAALMVGTRTFHAFRRARAMQTLYSHHSVGGYEVQADELVQRPVDRCRVAIYLTGPRQERMIWQAVSEQRHSDGCARHLDDAVADLLDRLPPRSVAREDSAPAS
ncbi:MAG: DUF4136 domain-containing protein [Myxococcota bacterium]